jgi:serine/threonine protein kinase
MKAARDRMKLQLNVSTQKDNKSGRKTIVRLRESEIPRLYKLGKQVMESTNTGMEVRFATRVADGVEVVIKTRMRPESFKNAADEREWRSTTECQLNMPKVETMCQYFEILETPQCYYVVMEKVEGKDLFEQMAESRLSHLDAREIVKQILQSLAIMHQEGRIHKDLKTENVMVDLTSPSAVARKQQAQGDSPHSPAGVKLIDFDTVTDWEPSSPKAKYVLGSDGYIAPEAYAGDYSPASDLYSVGVIMYRILTRRWPTRPEIFDDEPGQNYVGSPAMKIIQDRLRTEPINFTRPPLDRCNEAAELVAKLLSFEPCDRPSVECALAHDWFLIPGDKLP